MKKQLLLIMGMALCISLAGCQSSFQISNVSEKTEMAGSDTAAENESDSDNPSEEESTNEDSKSEDKMIDSTGTNTEGANDTLGVSVSFEDKSMTEKDENGVLLLTFTGNMPLVTVEGNATATDKINAYYIENQKSEDELIKEYTQYAKEDYKLIDSEQLQYWNGYGLGAEYRAARVDDSIISIVEDAYEYAGGAHPNSYRLAQNFDTQSGELLTLEDVLTDLEQGRKFINEYLRKLMKESEDEIGYFDNYEESIGDILNDSTWYLSEEGFVVICNEYIVSPHVAGIQEYVIPYKDFTYLAKKYQKN